MCKPSSNRILAVYGTEMGTTKNEADKVIDDWKKKENLTVTLLEGNDAADQFDSITPENYDLIVIMTSSYGDGDAPSGFGKFLYKLYAAVEAKTKPFDGLEHSVLGFGSTAYYTFQNVPRLCDRLLGEMGSRRFLMRTEIDEMDDYDENNAKIKNWSDSVAKYGKGNKEKTNTSQSVCEWSNPKSEVYEKKLGPDGYELGAGPSGNSGLIAFSAIGVAAIAAYFTYYRTNDESGVEA